MGNDPDNDFNLMILLILAVISLGAYEKLPDILIFLNKSEVKIFALSVIALLLFFVSYKILASFEKWNLSKNIRNQLYKRSKESSFCGYEQGSRKPVFVTHSQRTMHTQVIGTTNAGKTESVILPWAIQDIQKGHGLIIIDGKSDRGLLNKLWAYTCEYGREKDFSLFSLGHIEESSQYNPLLGNTPEEVTERVFSSFEFDNSYYKNIQYEVFANLIRIFFAAKEPLTFKKLNSALTDKIYLLNLNKKHTDEELNKWVTDFLALTPTDREQRVSGLKASVSHFSQGRTSDLFNTTEPNIDIDEALQNNKIIYFQLPVLLSPFLGRATGKMILQNIQSAVANRHRGKDRKPKFYSLFLDDFTEYLYPGFVSILNKSRSANIGVVFAHQALGDIQSLGESVANSILTNSNLKIFMRGNDPDSAEYFSKLIGTQKAFKFTERRKKTLFQEKYTGDQSSREVDEFIVHPNKFKKELGTGEAIMVAPVFSGSQTVELKFNMFPDKKTVPIPIKEKNHPPKETLFLKSTNKNSNDDDPIGIIPEVI